MRSWATGGVPGQWPTDPGTMAASANFRPAWHFCDAPYIAWAQIHRRILRNHYRGLWIMESDMEWAGSLRAGLASLNSDSSEYISVMNCQQVPAEWSHRGQENYGPNKTTYFSLVQIVRISSRLVLELGREIRRGRRVYCEALACTHCADMKYTTGGLHELLPTVSNRNHNSWSNPLEPFKCTASFMKSTENDTSFHIFHPCKW